MSNFFETPIEFLKGIGPAKADVLKKELGIFTFQDLMFHYPFRYIDRTKYYQIKEVTLELPFIQFVGKLINKQVVGERQGKRLVAQFEDATGMIECVWFQSLKWADKSLIIGTSYVVFGKPTYFGAKANIVHPEIETIANHDQTVATALQPVYNTTEKLKSFYLDSKGFLKIQKHLLSVALKEIKENLPESILWYSSDSENTQELPCKSMILALWDQQYQNSLRLDLWTKDMPVDEMKRFFYETLMTMSDSFLKATGEKNIVEDLRDYCAHFAEKMELNAKS